MIYKYMLYTADFFTFLFVIVMAGNEVIGAKRTCSNKLSGDSLD